MKPKERLEEIRKGKDEALYRLPEAAEIDWLLSQLDRLREERDRLGALATKWDLIAENSSYPVSPMSEDYNSDTYERVAARRKAYRDCAESLRRALSKGEGDGEA